MVLKPRAKRSSLPSNSSKEQSNLLLEKITRNPSQGDELGRFSELRWTQGFQNVGYRLEKDLWLKTCLEASVLREDLKEVWAGMEKPPQRFHSAAHPERSPQQKPRACFMVSHSHASSGSIWHTVSAQITTAALHRWLIRFPSGCVSKLAKNKCHAAVTCSVSKGSVFPLYFCLFNKFLIKFCFLPFQLMWWHEMKLFRIQTFLDFSLWWDKSSALPCVWL